MSSIDKLSDQLLKDVSGKWVATSCLEQFAQSVVKECTSVIWNTMRHPGGAVDLAQHAMLVHIISEINDRFSIQDNGALQMLSADINDAFKNGASLANMETP